ncbi:MAG: undecaprenyl-diphosphatase [Rhodospirillaceae bacterium TMED167]|nr:undecaprenyl-diphosphate phosphatase [Rhodospirillaceae bacterium]OUW26750.1 MAG: undecaprenyl-diphosphatase [Rhodospirillaceae bacterium TMED167]
MPLFQLFVLAAVQGITEFLPISSSGHLVLVPKFADWTDQGLLIDVAVHVGTLMAVMLYFYRDLATMTGAMFRSFKQISTRRPLDPEFWLVWKLVIATLPVVLAGYLMNTYLGGAFRSLEIIGWTTLGFGILLFLADKLNMTIRSVEHITFLGAFVIGLFQILALIPGTSRAGITMTAARFQGVERQDTARFSLLLSMPVIAAAGSLKGLELYQSSNDILLKNALTAGAMSFGFALVAITFLMVWLKRASFTPFAIYRVILGIFLLSIAYKFPDFWPL